VSGLEKSWSKFFKSGFYEQGWSLKIDPQRTREEVEGVLELLKPKSGSHIIDWCGGWGRHSVEFAKRGFEVTLLDFAPNHIERAKKAMQEAGVHLNLVCTDFRQTPSHIQANCAVNLFTAGISYLTEEDDIAALKSLHAALKPHALFMIDTMNLFWLVQNYIPKGWSESEDRSMRILESREFNFLINRNFSETTIIRRSGTSEEVQTLDHRIYSPAELASVLKRAGFTPIKLFGDFDGQPFTFDSRRIIMICEK
jgi:ubiquinone/menaquinone biosynthesis C-methylase UbiE